MLKTALRLTTLLLAVVLVFPTIGCQQKENMRENDKKLDVEVDVGKSKVKVKGSTGEDGQGGRLDVDVERRSDRDRESGEDK